MQCRTSTSRPFASAGSASRPHVADRKPATTAVRAQNTSSTKQLAEAADHQQQHHSRREQLLASVALLGTTAAVSSLSAPAPARAAAAACELTSSPSGLQFCDLKVGEGPEPVKGSLIRCHYTGRLASNGRVFDSSYERRKPLTFKIGVREVISGWDMGILGTEGVPAMREGGKRLLLIPSELGYGARGAGGVIPPNAQLEFEVELLGKRK